MLKKIFIKERDFHELMQCIDIIPQKHGATRLIKELKNGYKNNHLTMDTEYLAACSMLLATTERGNRLKKTIQSELYSHI